MSAWSLPCSPHVLTVVLQPAGNAPLPMNPVLRLGSLRSFGSVLEPRYIFGAGSLDQ